VGDRSRGRFADSPRHDGSLYSHVHERRESLGFVPRSRAILSRPAPNPNLNAPRLFPPPPLCSPTVRTICSACRPSGTHARLSCVSPRSAASRVSVTRCTDTSHSCVLGHALALVPSGSSSRASWNTCCCAAASARCGERERLMGERESKEPQQGESLRGETLCIFH
jgi:hypothetical protein